MAAEPDRGLSRGLGKATSCVSVSEDPGDLEGLGDLDVKILPAGSLNFSSTALGVGGGLRLGLGGFNAEEIAGLS